MLPGENQTFRNEIWPSMISFPKPIRIALTGSDYREFKFKLHALDNWRCRICGEIKPLTVSHMVARSKHREDTPENAISACMECHHLVTINAIIVEWSNIDTRAIRVIKVEGKQ